MQDNMALQKKNGKQSQSSIIPNPDHAELCLSHKTVLCVPTSTFKFTGKQEILRIHNMRNLYA